MTPPADVPLKDPARFRLVGQAGVPRLDGAARVTGRTVYGTDVRVPGLRFAAIRHAPTRGGGVVSFDTAPTLRRPGVQAAFALEAQSAVVVVADSFWRADQALEAALAAGAVVWREGPDAGLSTAALRQQLQAALEGPLGQGKSALAGGPGSPA